MKPWRIVQITSLLWFLGFFLFLAPHPLGALTINEKWNLLSNKCSTIPSSVFSPNSINSVWKWQGNKWAVYLPGQDTSGYANQKGFYVLTNIEPGEGFWVNAKSQTSIPDCPESSMVEDGILSLSEKWNLKGTRSLNKVYVDQLFEDPSKFESVWSWDTAKQSWRVFLPGGDTEQYASFKGFEVLTEIKPYEGFWVNSKTNATLDTAEAFLKETDALQALDGTFLSVSGSALFGGSPFDVVDLAEDTTGLKSFNLVPPLSGPLGGLLQSLLEEYIQTPKGLYAGLTFSEQCQSGSINFSVSWNGPDQPNSVYDIQNLDMKVTMNQCYMDGILMNGKMTIYIPGNYGYATSANVTMNNINIKANLKNEEVAINIPMLTISYSNIYESYNSLSFNATIKGATFVKEGNSDWVRVVYDDYKMNFAMSYNGSLTISVNGKMHSDLVNGKVFIQTINPLNIDSNGNLLSAKLKLSFRNNNILYNCSNNNCDTYYNDKYIGKYKDLDIGKYF